MGLSRRKELLDLLVLMMNRLFELRRVPDFDARSLSLTVKDGLMLYVRSVMASTDAAAAPLRALVTVILCDLDTMVVRVLV